MSAFAICNRSLLIPVTNSSQLLSSLLQWRPFQSCFQCRCLCVLSSHSHSFLWVLTLEYKLQHYSISDSLLEWDPTYYCLTLFSVPESSFNKSPAPFKQCQTSNAKKTSSTDFCLCLSLFVWSCWRKGGPWFNLNCERSEER